MMKFPSGNAICYSGYRRGQSPGARIYPSTQEIREDLRILHRHWRVLRLYDCSLHAERVLHIIKHDRLNFQVMLGAHLAAEMNNSGCPWGATYSEEQLKANATENEAEVQRLIVLARLHADSVFSVAVGNETSVDWTDHFVPVERLADYVRRVKASVAQPVTVCENYAPWRETLRDLVPQLDFISLHTYPVWEYKDVHDALQYSKDNYYGVARLYPDRRVVITEAGWATNSNGRGIRPESSSQTWQATYYCDLMDWTRHAGILTFVFEAFDEPWKGSADPMEPEKHWGLFTVDREPKQVVQSLYPELMRGPSAA